MTKEELIQGIMKDIGFWMSDRTVVSSAIEVRVKNFILRRDGCTHREAIQRTRPWVSRAMKWWRKENDNAWFQRVLEEEFNDLPVLSPEGWTPPAVFLGKYTPSPRDQRPPDPEEGN